LSPQHKEILDNICVKLGQSESETLRIAFLEHAKSISLITEKVHAQHCQEIDYLQRQVRVSEARAHFPFNAIFGYLSTKKVCLS